jgi:hypothetical protein
VGAVTGLNRPVVVSRNPVVLVDSHVFISLKRSCRLLGGAAVPRNTAQIPTEPLPHRPRLDGPASTDQAKGASSAPTKSVMRNRQVSGAIWLLASSTRE